MIPLWSKNADINPVQKWVQSKIKSFPLTNETQPNEIGMIVLSVYFQQKQKHDLNQPHSTLFPIKSKQTKLSAK